MSKFGLVVCALCVGLTLLYCVKSRAEMIMIAQLACDLTPDIEKTLQKDYKEITTAAGMDAKSRMVRLWRSDKSWTLTETDPVQGITCLIAAGKEWKNGTSE